MLFWNEFDQQLYSYPRKLKICDNLCTNQWGVVHPWHGTVANFWGRHKDFTEFNENFEKSYLLNGLSNIVKFFTVWFLKIFCIKWIHIFFWVQCSFNPLKTIWFCYIYNTRFPQTPAWVYSGLVFNGLTLILFDYSSCNLYLRVL